jgi:hypothetical protein
MTDPWEEPEVKAWMRRVKKELVPKIGSSRIVISIAPHKGKTDVKYAVELGMSIMLDKPIIVVAATNDDVPPKLRAVADKIIIGTIGEPGFADRIQAAMEEMT